MQCPFALLGLDKSATLEEIDKRYKLLILKCHPDKMKTGTGDTDAKVINDARDRAKQMYDTYECSRARNEKDEEDRKRKRKIMEIVKQIYDNEYDKLSTYYIGGEFFERRMKALQPSDRKEAEDIIQYGIGDSRIRLAKTEEQVTLLHNEAKRTKEEHQQQAREMVYALANATKEITELKANYEKLNVSHMELIQKNQQAISRAEEAEARLKGMEPKGSSKSPKHMHADIDKTKQLRQSVNAFLEKHIHQSTLDVFVSTQEIMEAFINNGNHTTKSDPLSKELRRQMSLKFPDAVFTRTKHRRGYTGIEIKER